jgi:hypothetical protein
VGHAGADEAVAETPLSGRGGVGEQRAQRSRAGIGEADDAAGGDEDAPAVVQADGAVEDEPHNASPPSSG